MTKFCSLTALSAVTATVVVLSACAPSLTTQPLPPLETAWQQSIQESYPSWTPPRIAPPHTPIPSNELIGEFPVTGQEGVIAPIGAPVEFIDVNVDPVFENVPAEPLKPVELTAKPVIPMTALTPAAGTGVTSQLVIKNPSLVKNGKYKVTQGDSLWVIAVKVYGRGSLFKAIIDANPDVNPNRIRPGIELMIPGIAEAEVMVTPAPVAPKSVPAVKLIPATPAVETAPIKEVTTTVAPASTPKTVVVPAVPVTSDTVPVL